MLEPALGTAWASLVVSGLPPGRTAVPAPWTMAVYNEMSRSICAQNSSICARGTSKNSVIVYTRTGDADEVDVHTIALRAIWRNRFLKSLEITHFKKPEKFRRLFKVMARWMYGLTDDD
jgi:hypothetical protein